jgi:competence protein ComEA
MSASDIRITAGDPSAYAFRVDLNSAPWQEIALVPGLGESKAKAIVEDREKKGSFESVEDLTRVPGIGEKTVSAISRYVRCQTQ